MDWPFREINHALACWHVHPFFLPQPEPGQRDERLIESSSRPSCPALVCWSHLPLHILTTFLLIQAADFVFGPAAGLSHEVTFKLLGILFELVALYNFFQQVCRPELRQTGICFDPLRGQWVLLVF